MSANAIPLKGSKSNTPDLDWSQIQETITLLGLAIAQIETSLTDGTNSVDKLTHSFTDIANQAESIQNNIRQLKGDENPEQSADTILSSAEDITHKINQAVVAFQFYDRISQRLDHVACSLDRLGCLISDPGSLYNPQSWLDLQQNIKSSYTMEAERLMFEHILQGATIEEALQIYRHHFEANDTPTDSAADDDIELF